MALAGLHLHPAWMGSRWTSVFAVAASAPAVRSPFPHQLQDGAPGHARPPSGCCVGRAPACPPAAPNEPLNHSPILTHPHLSLSGRPLPGTNADPLNLPYFQHSPGFPTTSSRRPSEPAGSLFSPSSVPLALRAGSVPRKRKRVTRSAGISSAEARPSSRAMC